VSAQRCQYIVPIVDIEEANAVATDQSQFSGQEVPKELFVVRWQTRCVRAAT
jgi:hypothetical protein